VNLATQKLIDRALGAPLLIALKPLVVVAGWLLRRDHGLRPCRHILVIKMLGGGSLVIALPALLGLRRSFANARLTLVTTTAVAPFARTLGVFDRILAIDTRSPLRLLTSTFATLGRSLGADTVLDLEVYSKLTTVFSLMTLARNRLGFYLESVVWRRPVSTHLVFFNRSAPVHIFYERMVALVGAVPASHADCRAQLAAVVGLPNGGRRSGVALGAGCSDLSRERMLSAGQWAELAKAALERDAALGRESFFFLGSSGEAPQAAEIIQAFAAAGIDLDCHNLCGQLDLVQSLRQLDTVREFWGIDSALLHYARLLGLRCVSYWGPTSPAVLLKPAPIDEVTHYAGLACSPCVHVAELAPCEGRNLCMTALLRELSAAERAELPPVVRWTIRP
jgi:ADP-heptose:LPS heptosyltransferase